MAVSKTLPQICILLTALYSCVSSQQATAPADPNSLFSNLLASSNAPGQVQPQNDPNTPSFGNMGGSQGFGASMGQNMGFLGGQPGGMQARGMPSGFPMSQMGGMGQQAAPAPLPRPSMSNSLMPMMLMSGSDIAQRMALMSMFNGGAGGMGGMGGMMASPLMLMGLMNSM